MKRLDITFGLILILLVSLLPVAKKCDAARSQSPGPQTAAATHSPNSNREAQSEQRNTTPGVVADQDKSQPPPSNTDDAKEKREELNLNARLTDYSGRLATYTYWLVWIGLWASVTALVQVALFYISIQGYLRPSVRIRSFYLINDLRSYAEDKLRLRFMLVLVNHGGSRAKVKSGNITIRITHTRDIPSFGAGDAATYRPPFKFLKNETIPCGPDSPFEHPDERVYSVREIQDVIEEKAFLHVVGFVWYRGRFQLRGYTLKFARRYDAKSNKMMPYGNPEFEFAD